MEMNVGGDEAMSSEPQTTTPCVAYQTVPQATGNMEEGACYEAAPN